MLKGLILCSLIVDFHWQVTRDFHRDLPRMEDMFCDAGCVSSLCFFLSCFVCSSACPEPEAVVAGLEDVAMIGEPVEQRGGHLGIAEHLGPLAKAEVFW